MKKEVLFINKSKWLFLLIIIIWVSGCTEVEKSTGNEESYDDVKKVAWDYLNEQRWSENAKDSNHAVVKKIIVNDNYELIDSRFEGTEAWSVSFVDKDNVLVGTPTILVDRKTKKVIGYMPGE